MCAPSVLFHLSAQPGPRLVAVKPQYDPCLSTMRFLMSVHPLTWSKPRTTWSSKKVWGSRAILTAAGRKLHIGRMTVSMLHAYIFCHLFVWKGAAQSDNGLRQVRFSPCHHDELTSWRCLDRLSDLGRLTNKRMFILQHCHKFCPASARFVPGGCCPVLAGHSPWHTDDRKDTFKRLFAALMPRRNYRAE